MCLGCIKHSKVTQFTCLPWLLLSAGSSCICTKLHIQCQSVDIQGFLQSVLSLHATLCMCMAFQIIDICGSFTRPIMTVPFLNLSVKFLAGLFVCFSPQHVSQPHAAAMLNYTNFSQRSLLFSSSYLFISQEHVIFSFLVTILVLKMLQLGVKGKTQQKIR